MDFSTIDGWGTLTLIAAAVLAGLLAGLYFAFTVAVMPAFADSSDRAVVETMRHINRKILNPWFLVVFAGGALLPLVAAVLIGIDGDDLAWPVVAAILALLGFGITVTRNVPLNEALDAAGPIDEIDDAGAVRAAFETQWVRWNRYRTVVSTFAFVALVVGLLDRS